MYDNLAILALGSNMGNKAEYIHGAMEKIIQNENIHFISASKIITTEPLEIIEQPEFLNSVVKISTKMPVWELLVFCQKTESDLGRIFRFDKGPREIDIDILDYNGLHIFSENLKIPHPAIWTRPFLKPLLEEIGEWDYLLKTHNKNIPV